MMKTTVLGLLFVFISIGVLSQEQFWEQRGQLSPHTPLTRYYINYEQQENSNNLDIVLSPSYIDKNQVGYSCEDLACPKIYIDDEVIRIADAYSSDDSYTYMQRTYYDRVGNFSYLIFSTSSQGDNGGSGYMYITENDSLYYNIKIFDNMGYVLNHYVGYSKEPPQNILGEIDFNKNSENIKKRIKNYDNRGKSNVVKMVLPYKGTFTFSNATNVNMRRQPNTKSEIVRKINTGINLEILEIIEKEPKEEYNWYKVKEIQFLGTIGYIYGAFLEPVEKEVK